MPLQTKIKRRAKDYNLSEKELAFATLIAHGWDEMSAWYIVYDGYGDSWKKDALENEISKLRHKRGVEKYLEDIASDEKTSQADIDAKIKKLMKVNESDLESRTGKEEMLRQLIAARELVPAASKEWLDIQKLITDINRLKKEEVKDETRLVHFYLPIKCNLCNLYIKERQKTHKE